MLELASLGAKVLHNRSVEMAKRYGVQLVVRSSLNHEEGTIVKENAKMEGMLISGVAADKNVARISVVGVKNEPGVAFKVSMVFLRRTLVVEYYSSVYWPRRQERYLLYGCKNGSEGCGSSSGRGKG